MPVPRWSALEAELWWLGAVERSWRVEVAASL